MGSKRVRHDWGTELKTELNVLTRPLWPNPYFPSRLNFLCCCCLVTKCYPTLCYAMACSPPSSSVHGISQAGILEWVAISFSRGSSRPRDQTWVSCISGRFFTHWVTWKAKLLIVPSKDCIFASHWGLDRGPSQCSSLCLNYVSLQLVILRSCKGMVLKALSWPLTSWNPGGTVTVLLSNSSLPLTFPILLDGTQWRVYGFRFVRTFLSLVSVGTCAHTCLLACHRVWSGAGWRGCWERVWGWVRRKGSEWRPGALDLADICSRAPHTEALSSWSACGLRGMGLGRGLGIKAALVAATVTQRAPGPPGSPGVPSLTSFLHFLHFLNYSPF